VPSLSRRHVLTLGGLVAMGGSLAFGLRRDAPDGQAGAGYDKRHLHITAHPDDDLYFFDPDLRHSVQDGAQTLGVCLTTGEADGRNFPSGDSRITDIAVDFTGYAAARQNGLRAAYAQLAAGDRNSPWRRERVVVAAGAPAELATLLAAPHVQLIFLNLWDEGSKDTAFGRGNLRTLWAGRDDAQPTMRPTGSPVPAGFRYTRQSLIDTLVGLLDGFRPTCVRLLDPDPDHQRHDAANPQNSDSGDFSDNDDHTAAALFGWTALQEHWRRGHNSVAESYRGYYNQRWPRNLTRSAYQQKLDTLAVYGWGDGRACGDPAGCGDLKLGDRADSRQYGRSTTHRYGTSVAWTGAEPDQRLTAYAVQGGRLVRWRESAPAAGAWDPAEVVGGAGLLPYLWVDGNAAGGAQIFAARMTTDADPRRQVREIVTIGQPSAGAPFDAWTGLGNPHDMDSDPVRRRGLGMPAVARYADGRLALFVRNFGGGVSSRVQAVDGGWQPWADLHGSDIQDGLAAVSTMDGRIELYAAGKTGVLRWLQDAVGGPWRHELLSVAPPAAPPTVARRPDGRLMLLTRAAQTSAVLAYQQTSDGAWDPRPIDLGGDGGSGPIAAKAFAGARLALAIRNDKGTVSVSVRHGAELDAELAWEKVGLSVFHTPAVGIDAQGRVLVTAMGTDGQPRARRRDGNRWVREILSAGEQ
jgi:LmbE family N-acetylglucosaminyl deacetylase